MFINDIHIFIYVGLGILGLLVGRLVEVLNENLPNHKPIFCKETLKSYFKLSKSNFIITVLMSVIYIIILYTNGFRDWLKLLEYLFLSPMLVSAFYIDWKQQIIPNRLTLTMWEVGIIFSVLRGINNLNVAIEMWIGMIVGAGIFLILTYIGNLIFRKETMGFGDVKIMGALRTILWLEEHNCGYYNFILYCSYI